MKKRIFGLCLFIFMFCIPAKVQAETLASTIVSDAESYVGKLRYVYGGTSLTTGADCSGFVMSVFAKFGISLPHSSAALHLLRKFPCISPFTAIIDIYRDSHVIYLLLS